MPPVSQELHGIDPCIAQWHRDFCVSRLVSLVQASMINIIGMSLIPMYKVVGPFLFFMSLLMIVWGGVAHFHILSASNYHKIPWVESG